MADVVAGHVPLVPVDALLSDRYDSLAKIGGVRMPVLVLHGDNDWVVPIALGQRLFAAAAEPKSAEWFGGRGHNNLDPAVVAARVLRFVGENAVVGAR